MCILRGTTGCTRSPGTQAEPAIVSRSVIGQSIRTDRLLLRAWRDDDVDAFTEMVLAPGFSEFLLPVPGAAAAHALIARQRSHFDEHGFGPWVVELAQTAEFIGCVGMSLVSYEAVFTPATEIAWPIATEHRGRGYATEAASATLADGFDRLRLQELAANTALQNRASRAVLERIGMEYALEFDHSLVPVGHPLRRQVLYRAKAPGSPVTVGVSKAPMRRTPISSRCASTTLKARSCRSPTRSR